MPTKILIKYILYLFINLNALVLYSQTPINGIIDSEIGLILSESPYLVENNLVITPNGQITIEPGVEVRFENGIKLEVRGTLLATGNSTDSINFTSNSGIDKGSWRGIDIKNTQGGNAVFNFCNFSNAAIAINEECCWGGIVAVDNSSFINNSIALGGYSGDVTNVNNCFFYNNSSCLTAGDKFVDNSVFDNNEYGLNFTERVSVANSIFTNHSEVALAGARGTISNCIIENNNIGVQASYQGFTLKNNTISNNVIGVGLDDYDGEIAPVDSNQICNNSSYNVINNSSLNTELYTNCWCDSDSLTIEDKILDGWDDSTRGLVDYTLYTEDCLTAIFRTVKMEDRIIYLLTDVDNLVRLDYQIYPNPTNQEIIIQGTNIRGNIKVYDYSGKIVFSKEFEHDDLYQIDLGNRNPGMYIVEFFQNENLIKQKVFKFQ